MARVVLVTGVSRYLGGRPARELTQKASARLRTEFGFTPRCTNAQALRSFVADRGARRARS